MIFINKKEIKEELTGNVALVPLIPGEEINFTVLSPAIIFVPEEGVSIHYSSGVKNIKESRQLFLLPGNFPCRLSSTASQQLIVLEIPDMVDLYLNYFSHPSGEEVNGFNTLFYLLPAHPFIKDVMGRIQTYFEEGISTPFLIRLKSEELFYFIKFYFPDEIVKSFFSPVITQQCRFALFILSNYQQVQNIEELARLAHYTPSGFHKAFRRVFGMSPYQWIMKRKIEHVYREIKETSKPIKVIAEENGFSTLSNLGDFCRKHIGMSPAFIRKKNQ